MDKEKFILNFIEYPEKYYLYDDERLSIGNNPRIGINDIVFFKIEKITFEDKAPRKEALENILSAMRIKGVNFLYLIKGNKNSVTFYYGIARDLIQKIDMELTVKNLGESILKPSIEGNFRGSKVTIMNESETSAIITDLFNMKCMENIEGVPGINEDNEKYQGVDRLVDVMLGDEFAFLVTAKALPYNAIRKIESNIYNFYDRLVPLSKRNIQKGESSNTTTIDTFAGGTNSSNSDSNQKSKTVSHGKTHQESRSVSKPYSKDETRTTGTVETDNEGCFSDNDGTSHTHTEGTTETRTTGTNVTEGKTSSSSYEFANKESQEWLKYIDDVILKRLDYGKGKGMYISTISLFSMERASMIKLKNTVTSLYSSDSGNKVPLRKNELSINSQRKVVLKNFQIPIGNFIKTITDNEVFTRSALSQYITNDKAYIGNWFSVNELSIIAGLPQKEIVGLALREEVEFGLNYNDNIDEMYKIKLGKMVQSGKILQNTCVSIDKRELSKHTFVTGVTGSGKTTTCQNLIIQSEMPFLVIEPAKTEYRILTQNYDDILIFTLGKDKVAPFRLNPFEFFSHESITSHVDMIKASIESAFEMEAAIPQIIEKALYECYKDCGWNIADDTNRYFNNPFEDGVYAFPTFSELIEKTEEVVKNQGFDSRLQNDYIGSIRARLQGLIVGSKGLMLNTRRSIDFRDLVHHKVILELEEIRSGSEKALIMGFILSNLMEAIKAEYYNNPDFSHITLVEEAHRLLGKYEPGDSLSKKQGIEMFADMLAEVRKYGEALIIADQIPGKLTPEVLKNTNTKIVHKIFAQDDKDAIGNTMSLSDEQKEFLSSLDKGRSIVFSQGWEKSLQIQVIPKTNTTSKNIIGEKVIRNIALRYYYKNYLRGIFPEVIYKDSSLTYENFTEILKSNILFEQLENEFKNIFRTYTATEEFKEVILKIENILSIEEISLYLRDRFYFNDKQGVKKKEILKLLNEVKNNITDLTQFDETLSFGRRR